MNFNCTIDWEKTEISCVSFRKCKEEKEDFDLTYNYVSRAIRWNILCLIFLRKSKNSFLEEISSTEKTRRGRVLAGNLEQMGENNIWDWRYTKDLISYE